MRKTMLLAVAVLLFGCGGGSSGTTNDNPDNPGYDPSKVIDCIAPWVTVDLADGTRKQASELQVGDTVWTQPDTGGDYGTFTVDAVAPGSAPLMSVTLLDPTIPDPSARKSLQYSATHELNVEGKGWTEVRNLAAGDRVLGRTPHLVEQTDYLTDEGVVIQISVATAHTYETLGIANRASDLAP